MPQAYLPKKPDFHPAHMHSPHGKHDMLRGPEEWAEIKQGIVEQLPDAYLCYRDIIGQLNVQRPDATQTMPITSAECRRQFENWFTQEILEAAALLPQTIGRPLVLIGLPNVPPTPEDTNLMTLDELMELWGFASAYGNVIALDDEGKLFLERYSSNELTGYNPSKPSPIRFKIAPTYYDTDKYGENMEPLGRELELDIPHHLLGVANLLDGVGIVLASRGKEGATKVPLDFGTVFIQMSGAKTLNESFQETVPSVQMWHSGLDNGGVLSIGLTALSNGRPPRLILG